MAAALLASTAAAAGPSDLGSLTLAQRTTLLPPETIINFRGKSVTLGALRKAHAALLAHFASLGGLKPDMPAFKKVVVTRTSDGASAKLFTIQPIVSPVSPSTTSTPTTKHVPNAAPPPQPIDYVTACSKISLCVYVPPYHSYDAGFISFKAGTLVIEDPLLSADVCQQDGGTFGADTCSFVYLTDQKISVFPGNPPNLQSSVNCPAAEVFSTAIDPLGGAEITSNFQTLVTAAEDSSQGLICAVDLATPS
jgi:hypothetical protein